MGGFSQGNGTMGGLEGGMVRCREGGMVRW